MIELHEKGKIALGTVLPKNPENFELSLWPKIKRLVSFWWIKCFSMLISV